MNVIVNIIIFNNFENDLKYLRNLIKWFFIFENTKLQNLDILMKLKNSLKVEIKWLQACLKKMIKCITENNISVSNLHVWIWFDVFIKCFFKCLWHACENTLFSERMMITFTSENCSKMLLIMHYFSMQSIFFLIFLSIWILSILLSITSNKSELSFFETANVWYFSSHDARYSATYFKLFISAEKKQKTLIKSSRKLE